MLKKIVIGNRIMIFGMPACGSDTLPETDFDFCTPNVRVSEIRRIFIARVSAGSFINWTSAGEWTIRMSETGTENDVIRPLTVIGDKPTPSSIRKLISNDRRITVLKTHSVSATIDEVSDANHEFVRYMGMGKPFRMWYETMGGYMFGGNDGIMCHVEIDMVLPRGIGEIMTYQLTAGWNSLQTEERCISPIFDDIMVAPCSPCDSVTFSNVDDDSLDVQFTADPGTFQYILSSSSTRPETGYTTTSSTALLSFTGLEADTIYYFYVRRVCADGGFSDFISASQITGGAAPVLPITTGLRGMYSGSYGVHKTAGLVTQWDDLSGYGNHLLPTGMPSIAVASNEFGTEDALNFASGTDILRTVGDFIGLTGSDKLTIFIVKKYTVVPNGQCVMMYAATDNTIIADGFAMWQSAAGGVPYDRFEAKGNVGMNTGFVNASTGAHIYSIVADKSQSAANEVKIKMDKIILGTESGSNNTSLNYGSYKLTVGVTSGLSIGHLVGKIGFMAIFTGALSSGDVDTITDYLMTKYSL